jgi:hypothetical protein
MDPEGSLPHSQVPATVTILSQVNPVHELTSQSDFNLIICWRVINSLINHPETRGIFSFTRVDSTSIRRVSVAAYRSIWSHIACALSVQTCRIVWSRCLAQDHR